MGDHCLGSARLLACETCVFALTSLCSEAPDEDNCSKLANENSKFGHGIYYEKYVTNDNDGNGVWPVVYHFS